MYQLYFTQREVGKLARIKVVQNIVYLIFTSNFVDYFPRTSYIIFKAFKFFSVITHF